MNENEKREMTVTSVVLGCLLAIVFGAANAYLGLRVGLTISASIPAAVISMGVMRFLLKRDSPLENNMAQTIGSAGQSLAAGTIFTMPVLYLWADEGVAPVPNFWSLTVLALAGGALGVLFMVPLRKPLIVDEEKTLVYPEGRACAEVIKAGAKGATQASVVFLGLGLAVAVKLVTDLLKWIPSALQVPFRLIRGQLGLEFSPALAGVGFIVGPKISSVLFAGSFLGWMMLIPVFCCCSDGALSAYGAGGASGVWRDYIRYVGAGAIAAGGFWSLAKSLPVFVRTFRDSLKGAGGAGDGEDLPLRTVVGAALAVIVLLAVLPIVPVGVGGALLVALFGFFFAAVSARMVGFVGSSNNPVSGMAIATLVVAALVLKTCGRAGAAGMVTAISIGSLVCIVAAMAGDTAQDLKTGRLLGATPWKQQLGMFFGTASSGLAIVAVLILLHRAWGFGGDQIPAPQATLMKVIVEGIMGGTLPWGLLGIGVGIAAALVVCRVPVMPFAIGLYLPVHMIAMIFVGGLARHFVDRRSADVSAKGVLLSAGMIAGEGLCGILLAVLTLVLA